MEPISTFSLPDWSEVPVRPSTGANATGASKVTASFGESGVHTLRFTELTPITVADRMGYQNPMLEKVIELHGQKDPVTKEIDRELGISRMQERLVGFDYDIKENHIDAVYEYELPYGLYPIYLPYEQLKQKHPKLCKILLNFLVIAKNIGISFWFESYYSDSLIWMYDDNEEGYFEEEADEEAKKVVREAKAIRDAAEKVRLKRPKTLKKKLHLFQTDSESEREVIKTLIRWIDFLGEEDTIDHYVKDTEEEEREEEAILPSDRFIVLPDWGKHGDEWWQESLQNGECLPIVIRFRLDEQLHIPAIPTFPMRMSDMMVELFDSLKNLMPDNND